MSKESEHEARMELIESDPAMLHDFNLITTIFVTLPVEVVSARVLDVRRMDSNWHVMKLAKEKGWKPLRRRE